MRIIKIITILLCFSCAPAIEIYEYTPGMLPDKYHPITFGSVPEAWRVKRRYERRGFFVEIHNKTIYFTKEQIELSRPILKNWGYIRERYKYQIKEQL